MGCCCALLAEKEKTSRRVLCCAVLPRCYFDVANTNLPITVIHFFFFFFFFQQRTAQCQVPFFNNRPVVLLDSYYWLIITIYRLQFLQFKRKISSWRMNGSSWPAAAILHLSLSYFAPSTRVIYCYYYYYYHLSSQHIHFQEDDGSRVQLRHHPTDCYTNGRHTERNGTQWTTQAVRGRVRRQIKVQLRWVVHRCTLHTQWNRKSSAARA